MRFVAGKGVVAERHREDAGRGAVAAEMLLAGRCWPGRCGGGTAGWGAVADSHREEAGQGAVAATVGGRGGHINEELRPAGQPSVR